MRLGKLIAPPRPYGAKEYLAKHVFALLDRDDEIRRVVNSNAKESVSRPTVFGATTNGATEVTLVESPPPGQTRLVNMLAVYFIDISGSSYEFTFYLDNGSTHYNLYYNSSISWTDSAFYPSSLSNRPIVVANGWDLKAVTEAGGAALMDLTAHYEDDAPYGEASSAYRFAYSATPAPPSSTSWFTLIDEPPEGVVYRVHQVTFSNDDDTAHHYAIGVYDISGTVRRGMYAVLSVSAGACGSFLGGGQAINVPHGWRLDAQTTVAQSSAASHWTAHYKEVAAEDSGEG